MDGVVFLDGTGLFFLSVTLTSRTFSRNTLSEEPLSPHDITTNTALLSWYSSRFGSVHCLCCKRCFAYNFSHNLMTFFSLSSLQALWRIHAVRYPTEGQCAVMLHDWSVSTESLLVNFTHWAHCLPVRESVCAHVLFDVWSVRLLLSCCFLSYVLWRVLVFSFLISPVSHATAQQLCTTMIPSCMHSPSS